MPDITFDSEDKIPEGLKEFAKKSEDGSVFIVKVSPTVKVDEFRNKNVELSKERDTILASLNDARKLVGEDLTAFETELSELRAVKQQVADGKLKGTNDVEAEVTRRVESMKKNFETQLSEKAKEAGEAMKKVQVIDAKWRQTLIDRFVTDAVLDEKNGADPRALNDILKHSYSIFKVRQDETIVPMDGEAVVYGADGATPMSPAEWLTKLRESAPYFFKVSNGGGANGGQGSKKFAGLSEEQFKKLPARERLALAHKHDM